MTNEREDAPRVAGDMQEASRLSTTTDDATEAAIERGIADAQRGRLMADGETALGARPAADAVEARAADLARIQPGWAVYASDGADMGPVSEVAAAHLTIAGASRAGRDMYIPREYIESTGEQRLTLNRPRSLLLDMNLDTLSGLAALAGVEQADPPEAPPANERSIASERAPARTPTGPEDASGIRLMDIGDDWDVYDSSEHSIGKVERVSDAYLEVRSGMFVHHSRYVPAALVGSVDSERRRVFLTQSRDTLDDMDLDQPPIESGPATGRQHQEPLSSRVLDAPDLDEAGGPTHQPSVTPDYEPVRGQPTEYAPFRSSNERNETDLDLNANRAPGIDPFGSQESAVGKPIPPGSPSVAERELPPEPGEAPA